MSTMNMSTVSIIMITSIIMNTSIIITSTR